MIGAILLAAGSASRFGSDKLLACLPDRTPIALAAARTLIAAVPQAVVVVRAGAGKLEALLRTTGLGVTVCPNADEGMGASLAWGVAVTKDWDGWIVTLADMPFIRPATISAVAAAITKGSAAIAAPSYRGERGHPVGFSAAYRDALLALQGDRGASDVVAAAGDRLHLIACDDPGVLADIDVPDDLAGLAFPGARGTPVAG